MLKKADDAAHFEKLEQQLHSFLTEMSELSRKKPNDPVNKFKLKFINTALKNLNSLLEEDRPFDDFEAFDLDDIPTNSDVVVLLSQYVAAVHRFRIANTEPDGDDQFYWRIRGKLSGVPTADPSEFEYLPERK